MTWWSKLWKGFGEEPKNAPERPRSEPAEWLAADDPGNPFDVPILDLMSNLRVTSTTEDPVLAERSVSWRAGQDERLAWKLDGERFSCDLRYDAATSLPDGMLFVPAAMEDKWVIAWRQGKIAAARSWTGATEAIAEAHLEAGRLRISSLSIAANSTLRALGDPVGTFDWLIKSHALNERIPLPVSAEGAEILRGVPLASFGPFGHRCFCAAVGYAAPKSKRRLRSDGALIAAVQDGDAKRIKQLIADGNDIHAPSTFRGYTALHLAVVKGELELVKRLLELGADPNQQADEARTVLPLALVHGCNLQIVDLLLEAGAHLEAPDDNGFRPLHAAAEVGSVPGIRYLLTKDANLQAPTKRGLTPLHIACALGHLEAARELVSQGADPTAPSDLGTPLEVARREGRDVVVDWLGSR